LASLALWTLWTMTRDREGPARPLSRYDVQLLDKATVSIVFRPATAVSADGSTFAFVGVADGINRIYLRSRNEVTPRAILGSEGGASPALSPDGRSVAFFADGAVRKANRDGGVVTLGPARDVRGITWVDASSIVLTLDSAAPLVSMSPMGGEPHAITSL